MQEVWHQVLRLPVVGDFIYYTGYLLTLVLWGPVLSPLYGGQRLKFGGSVFWMPRQKAQVVCDGVALLRSRDPEMFFRLTSKQRLIIYNFEGPKLQRKSGHRLFFMHSKFVDWGPQGVACFIVQSLMTAAAVQRINRNRLNEQEEASLRSISRNMADWLRLHSFHPGLISALKQFVER